MANTKKAAAESASQQDRLWNSLDYSYGKKREETRKAYKEAYSNLGNQMLKRGMQRSSAYAHELGHLSDQEAKAIADTYDQQNAEYMSGLNSIEDKLREQENWERSFNQQQQQIDWNQKFQQNQLNWQKDQAKQQFDYQKSRDAVSDDQWKQSFDYQKDYNQMQFDYSKMTADQQYAYTQIMQILQAGNTPSADLLARAGLSKADYKAMLKKQKSGSYTPKDDKGGDDEEPTEPLSEWWKKLRDFGKSSSHEFSHW